MVPEPRPESFDVAAVAAYARLYRQSRQVTRHAEDAEDLVQEAYVRALQSSSRFAWGTNLKAWLLTILRNAATNRWRDRQRSRVVMDGEQAKQASDTLPATEDTPEQALLRETLDPDLKAAFERLPKVQRDAVWLRYVEEMRCAEIASVLGVPLGTVLARISRGRRRLYRDLTGRLDRSERKSP